MKQLIFTITAVLFFTTQIFAQSTPPRYDRVKVDLTQHSISQLAALGLEVDHGEYQEGRHFINDFSEFEINAIAAAGFEYEVLIEDMSAFYVERSRESFMEYNSRGGQENCAPDVAEENTVYPVPSNFRLGDMAGFYRYEDMKAILDTMRMLYPNLISSRQAIDNIATHEGRPIYWLRISDNPDNDETNEPEVFYNALHHAREPNSLTQMIYYMWYLLENYDTDPEIQFIVDNTEMYFMPCINPDGYIYNETTNPDGGGLWRKNRRFNNDGTYGVDLNRNYGYEWAYDDFGSSPNPGSEVYRGTSAFSEPETQAVRELCNQHEFVVTLNYHTHGNLLIYPWGYSDTPTDESETFNTLADVMTIQNNYLAGTGSETVGYTVNGDSDDWMYGETASKPAIYSMTPEVGAGDIGGGFWPTIPGIIPNCQASMWMNIATALTPHVAALSADNPAQQTITLEDSHFRFLVQRYGRTAGDVIVSLASLNADVTVIGGAKVFDLPENGMISDSFALSISDQLATGTELLFLLSTDNGSFVHTDTVRKTFSSLIGTSIVEDQLSTLDDWNNIDSSWDLSTESFVSAPTALTDSPFNDYANNSYNEITLTNPIAVGEAEQYLLHFWTKWDIEVFYDYAQLSVSVNNGVWIPVCGKYTVDGSDIQDPGQPVYEGKQDEWVEEEVDLTGLVTDGDEFRLKYSLTSDNWVNPDGYYVDDISFTELIPDVIEKTTLLNKNDFDVEISPNPGSGPILVKFQFFNSPETTGQWQLFHTDGQLLKTGDLQFNNNSAHFTIDGSLPAGVYWVGALLEGQHVPLQKLVVVR